MPRTVLVEPSRVDPDKVVADKDHIQQFNRQRHEFDQLSHICLADLEAGEVAGVLDIPKDIWWARGHVPERPLMPGVLMIECAAQVCSWFVYQVYDEARTSGRIFGFGGIQNVKFRASFSPPAQFVGRGQTRRDSAAPGGVRHPGLSGRRPEPLCVRGPDHRHVGLTAPWPQPACVDGATPERLRPMRRRRAAWPVRRSPPHGGARLLRRVSGSSCLTTRAGAPTATENAGTVAFSRTTAPAPMMAPSPMVLPPSKMAPIPTRTQSPTLTPCTMALCPMVTSLPMSLGAPGSTCTTALSWMLVRAPMVIGASSPRICTPYQTLASRPRCTLAR